MTQEQKEKLKNKLLSMTSVQVWEHGVNLVKNKKITLQLFGEICAYKLELLQKSDIDQIAFDFGGVVVNENEEYN